MKALTICQPYAHLICLPDEDDRCKRVENRRWPTTYTGPLLIHAGKSRDWLTEEWDVDESEMEFGAIIGFCRLAGCFRLDTELSARMPPHDRLPIEARRQWPWLKNHSHVEGPYCFVLEDCRRLLEPIPFRGAQGFFNVPDELIVGAEQNA